MTETFISSSLLLFTLLNPFLVIVYLVDVVQKLEKHQFRRVLLRAGLIATAVFCIFAILGDAVFVRLMQVEFASFKIFGGIIFMLIGIQFVFKGPTAIEMLRGESEHVAGAIAMPVLIGPGTISASVVIGQNHSPLVACGAVIVAVTACLATIVLLKSIHDRVRPRREALIQRYIEIAGRITALYVGTVAIEMIMQGLDSWLDKF
ncbi:MAG: MarC family protein [Desulfobulbales bacterium]|nr:MarC family protein [Desulfobulbales bacterium]